MRTVSDHQLVPRELLTLMEEKSQRMTTKAVEKTRALHELRLGLLNLNCK